MTIERSGAPAAPGAAAKTATVAGRPHAVGANHAGGAGARSFLSVLSSVGSQKLEAPAAPAMANTDALAAGLPPLPALDPAELLGQGQNRMIQRPEPELAGQPDVAEQPAFAGRADIAEAGIPAVPVFGMLPVPAAVGPASAARDAGTELLERAAGGPGRSSARPGATGSGAPTASAGLATDRLENAVDARATAGLQTLPAPDPAELLGQGQNRMIQRPEPELAGQPDVAEQPAFAGRADIAEAGIPAVPVFGMLPVPAAVGPASAARDAGTELLERAAGGPGRSSARPGATGSGAPTASAGPATDRLENAVDARAAAAPEHSAGLLSRVDAKLEPTPADTGLAPLLKSVGLRSGSLREAAAAADTQWHAGQPTRGADAATGGGALSEALAGLARGPASPRGAERPLLRPLLAAGSASAGSWAEQAMAGANNSVGVTYTIEPATPVPEMAVAEKLNYWIARGVQNAELKLDAFGGGSVDVSISVNGNEAMVEFRTDQPEARRMLQDAMGQLRQLLEGEGLFLSGGFVGTSAQRDPGAQDRRSQAQAVKSAPALVELRPTEAASAMSRTPGRAVDLFV